nr:flagellar hook-basal body complex protein [Cryptomonas paramecium]
MSQKKMRYVFCKKKINKYQKCKLGVISENYRSFMKKFNISSILYHSKFTFTNIKNNGNNYFYKPNGNF